MKISRIEIVNFRSIRDLKIRLRSNCRVLVGINESGKTNILKALSLLSEDVSPVKKDDVREPLQTEKPIEESYIRFIFDLEQSDYSFIFENVTSGILCKTENPNIVKEGKRNINLKDFCRKSKEALYKVDILEEKKSPRYWKLKTKGGKILEKWKRPSGSCPPDFMAEDNGENFKLADFKLVNVKDYPEIPDDYLQDSEIEDISKLVGGAIINLVEENLPDTIFWEYDEDDLLPPSVNINEFIGNPDTCTPLRNMFVLGGIEDIKGKITEAKKGTDNQFQNFLDGIAKKTTKHFRNVWKEYKAVEFALKSNSDNIIPAIKEENCFDFYKRSDGFKRFVTFLLMISVNVDTDRLKGSLLLIDEPDLSLHPSGARYLRKELIRISKKNYIVYSTHSIFMIDPDNIERHVIVSKKNEKTDITEVNESNIFDEEVLFNALGHSVFATLKKKNIIFEGWKDKKLFQVAMKRLPNGYGKLKKDFKDIGICHARGVKHIKSITPLMELAGRECVIVSDSDAPAREKQGKFCKDRGYGIWYRYDEIEGSIKEVTGEDFVKSEVFVRRISRVQRNNPKLSGFDTGSFSGTKEKITFVRKWLQSCGFDKDEQKDFLSKITEEVFQELKTTEIKEEYYKMLCSLAKKLV